jgi:acyl-CoA thioesterase
MTDFNQATAAGAAGPGKFSAQIPEGWQQGRGAFGGLTVGILERAAEQHLADPGWPLRALNAEIFGPVVAGPAEVTIETMRRGSGMATLLARLSQEGEPRARATAIFGKTRVNDRELVTLQPPAMKPFEDLPRAMAHEEPPVFTHHLDYRPIEPLAFSGAKVPLAQGWIRFNVRPAKLAIHDVIGLIDAYWPAIFAIEPAPRPMATVSFTFQPLIDPAELDPEAPYMYRCTVPAAHHGFAVEMRELWTREGRLVALNQQSFVTIK